MSLMKKINPKVKDFFTEKENITMMGLMWAFYWRWALLIIAIMLLIMVVAFGFGFIAMIAGLSAGAAAV
ncbi:hypothetical protein KAR28_02490 [Candidatus Parcubacteria bacterium]|nr:hypothetical protein [Candidatus Parcubacteria bacterium]